MKSPLYALACALMLTACSSPESLRTSQFSEPEAAVAAPRTFESVAEGLLDAESDPWDSTKQMLDLQDVRMTRLLMQFEGELSGEFLHELLLPGSPSPVLDQSTLGMRLPLSPQVARAELHLNLKLPLNLSGVPSRDALISVRQTQGSDPEAELHWSDADLKSPDLFRLQERLQSRKTPAGRELHLGIIEEWGAKLLRARSGSAYQIRTLIWSPRNELLLTWEAELKSARSQALEKALDAVLESGRALTKTHDQDELRSRLALAKNKLADLESLSAGLPRLQEYCAKIHRQYERLDAAL